MFVLDAFSINTSLHIFDIFLLKPNLLNNTLVGIVYQHHLLQSESFSL